MNLTHLTICNIQDYRLKYKFQLINFQLFNWLVLKDTIKLLLIELKLIKPNIISNINNDKKNILMLDLGIILNILKEKILC